MPQLDAEVNDFFPVVRGEHAVNDIGERRAATRRRDGDAGVIYPVALEIQRHGIADRAVSSSPFSGAKAPCGFVPRGNRFTRTATLTDHAGRRMIVNRKRRP